MLLGRRLVLAGGAIATLSAAQPPSRNATAKMALDEAAAWPPGERLKLLRSIDQRSLSPGVALDVAAAQRGARLEDAIARAPEQDRYPLKLRLQSGSDLTPDAAYVQALAKARSLTARADRLLRTQGMVSGSVAARLRSLARDPRFLYSEDDAGRDRAIADMNRWLDAARARLPALFARVPAGAANVRVVRMTPEEERAAKAGYRTLPSADHAGAYHVDLHAIARRPSWSLPSVVHHELLPGHMIQLPLQAVADPHPLRLKAAPGFVEGWAIYAEQLAAEHGVYADDPLAEIGYIQWMLFRLGRSLIDTGINHLRWTRESAIAYLSELQGDPVIFASFEKDVERVPSEPGSFAGQAGVWLEIARRHNALRGQGDLRIFHDRLLKYGSAPIALLLK